MPLNRSNNCKSLCPYRRELQAKLFNERHWRNKDLPVMHFSRVARIAEIVGRPMPYFHFGLPPALLPVSAVSLESPHLSRLPTTNHQPQPASSPTCLTSQQRRFMNRRTHGSLSPQVVSSSSSIPGQSSTIAILIRQTGVLFSRQSNSLPIAILFNRCRCTWKWMLPRTAPPPPKSVSSAVHFNLAF